MPVLFVHGHRGHYNQSKSFVAVAQQSFAQLAQHQQQISSVAPLDFFTVDFLEESSAFSSDVMWAQAA